jgi:hypothetical protein
MAKDASLFSSLKDATKKENFVANDDALNVVGYRKIEFHNGMITNVYRIPILSSNLLLVPQITQTGKKVEFWPNQFLCEGYAQQFCCCH